MSVKRTNRGYGATVRLLWETSRPLALAVGVYAIAASLLPVAVLLAAGHLVGDVPPAARHGLSSSAGTHMFVALALTGAAYAATLLLGPAQSGLSSAVKWRLVYRTQDRLIAAVARPVGIAHLEDPAVLDDLALAQGQLINQLTADAPMTLALVISNRASGLIACGVLASVRWWLGLGMLIMWTIVRRPQLRLIRESGRQYSDNSEVLRRAWYLQRLALQTDVAKESRVFGLGGWLVERYRSQALLGLSPPWRTLRRLDRTVLVLAGPVLIAYAGAVAYLGIAAYHHHISLATLAVMLPMVVATMSYGDISWDDVALAWMLQGLPRAGRLERALAPSAGDPEGHTAAAGRPEREIRFEHVSFRYPSAPRPVFEDLSLAIPAGRSTALVGLNGAGKTTLVKLLARLHDPGGGRILVDGTTLADLEPSAWQRQVAVVFQDFVQYPLTLRENIGWGAPAAADDFSGLQACAQLAGVPVEVGWDRVLSRSYDGGIDLSGGQWQRVALARALFAIRHGARLLVLDEPTAWLDARGEADFFDRFLRITAGTTSLIISHRFSTVRRADHICVLERGQVLEQGDHESLLAAGNRYAELFRIQAARYEDPA